MVPLEQEDQSQEEDGIPLLEGFQWESLMGVSASSPSRKRSLSESSLSPACSHSLLAPQPSKQVDQKEEAVCSEQQGLASPEKVDRQQELELLQPADREEESTSLAASLERCDSVLGDSSSGTELCDGQGTGKRRRAARVSQGSRVIYCCMETGSVFTVFLCFFCLAGCSECGDLRPGAQQQAEEGQI